ncbi:pseudouridine synthase [Winogradskyella alexanderae]|uniref:Pseudouridine synthase n=1 Tax=Winogradskyella alexanderae TaxID=2877123 RepID=A0ABS7XRZ1_9FLAO|nr:pseudouridine synthase [Winogradskyella alexanderae]MCA0132781.1 pseudouridine synthase [Winogradskyella alexanderae]
MHYYYKLYKPYGYLSQFINNQNKRKSKRLLGDLYEFPAGTMAVGRLDEKSEGLLLLTTDGKFSYNITNSNIEKEYHVMVDGIIKQEHIEVLSQGIPITVKSETYTTKPCKVSLLKDTSHIIERPVRDLRHGPTSWLSITLTEGKYRQVRKMTATVGCPTLRLVRVRIGPYFIDDMKPAEVWPIRY